MLRLFYLDDSVYWESGTLMSSLYVCDTYERYDWGFVEIALRKGQEVSIRPANEKEWEWANSKLKIISQ